MVNRLLTLSCPGVLLVMERDFLVKGEKCEMRMN